MTERMTPERFAEWMVSDEAGELTWDEERPDSVAELWFALVAEREHVEAIKEHAVGVWCSKGCTCCEDTERMEFHEAELAKLLDIPAYDDESGYQFYAIRDEIKAKKEKGDG